MVDKKWSIVSTLGQTDSEPKEVELCFLEDSHSWILYSNSVSDSVLVPRIQQDTRAAKHGKAFVNVDKFGLKFKDDSQADTFLKALEIAK